MKISNLKIGTRLAAVNGLVLLMLAVVTAIAWLAYDAGTREALRMSAKIDGIVQMDNARNAMWELRFGIANFMTANDEGKARITGAEAKWVKMAEDALKAYEGSDLNDEEKAALAQVRDVFGKYVKSRAPWFELFSAGKLAEAAEWRAKNTNAFGAGTVKGLATQIDLATKAASVEVETMKAQAQRGKVVLASLSASMLVIALGLIFLLNRSITRPVSAAKARLETIAEGDLTGRIEATSRDEIGQMTEAIAKMQQRLAAIVGGIRTSSEAIDTASGQITSGNTELSSRTEEQASSLEETASSMEELTSIVKQNAENAKQANQLAVGASAVAAKGGQVVGEVVTTMDAISGSSKKIADIISVIDGIAFQTNILALNAAVEAARAGEQGRGFAVVATEVRSLAQRSAAAAKEIKELISDSVAKVESGSKLVNDAGKTMEEVVTAVKRVTDIMGEISAASAEQSSGIEQVNQAITQMDQATQQNAALVEESAAAAETMKEQAQGLVAAVSVFKLSGAHVQAPAGVTVSTERPARTEAPAPARAVERRSKQRATNVARLPATPAAAAGKSPDAPARPARAKVAGGNAEAQEWTDF